MHSGLLVFLWLIGVAVLQFFGFGFLMVAVLVCGAGAMLLSGARCRRLVKRVRFILLAIVILFAGFTPGEALFIDWPRVSPSREGLMLAIEHVGRVLAVVFCVSMLMEALPAERLVGALYSLMRPFESVGFPAARVAVRTLLVLRFVESATPRRWHDWLDEDDVVHDPITVHRETFGAYDFVALGVLGVLTAGALLTAWGGR